MAGIEGLVLQDRDRRLLVALETMRIIARDQAMRVAGFHSITPANTRLLRLKKAGLLRRLFIGGMAGNRKALYVLSNKGAAVAGVKLWHLYRRRDDRLVVDPLIEHQLAVNALRIQITQGALPVSEVRVPTWKVFQEPISASVPIAPDGYFELQCNKDSHPMFLEVDRGTEGQRIWKKKIESYLHLAMSEEFMELFGHERFRVLVVANSGRRLESIRKAVSRYTDKIFWFATFPSINSEGFWASLWLRPNGDRKQSLLPFPCVTVSTAAESP